MQLNIIYNESFVLNNIQNSDQILKIKESIEKKYNIPICQQSLLWCGKNLKNNHSISHYNIKNNDLIFLSNELKGGNVVGFPDVGHLILLLSFSIIILLLFNLFFSNIYNYFASVATLPECKPSLADINSQLNSNSAGMSGNFSEFHKVIGSKLDKQKVHTMHTVQKGGQFLENNGQNIYNIATLFYSALSVIIITIYFYTVYCNEGLSNWIIIGAFGTLLTFLIGAIISNKLLTAQIISQPIVMKIMTITSIIMAIVLFLITIIVPFIKKTDYLHWSTYIYPFTVVLAMIYLNWMKIENPFLNIINKIIALIALICVPYIVAYIYNVNKLCA